MIRIWLSEDQAKSVLVLVSLYLAKFDNCTEDSVPKQKWQQIYDMIGAQIEQQKKSDDI